MMALPVICDACFAGAHEKCEQNAGMRAGLIGGHYCPCEGECAEIHARAVALVDRLFGGALHP